MLSIVKGNKHSHWLRGRKKEKSMEGTFVKCSEMVREEKKNYDEAKDKNDCRK